MFTTPAVALPQKKRSLRGRRLVVVDIENVVGGAVLTEELARLARRVVESTLDIRHDEQVVIATSHIGLFTTRAAWPTARLKARSGENGADIELLTVLTAERVEERFDEVVVVSGDGIFTEAVATLGSKGVAVTVVSWAGRLSRQLRLAARRHIHLDHLTVRHVADKEVA